MRRSTLRSGSEAAALGGPVALSARRVKLGASDLLVVLPEVGPITLVTANECVALRSAGVCRRIDTERSTAELGDRVVLSLFPDRWAATALHVDGSAQDEGREGLQFFDRHGRPILEVVADSDDGAAAVAALADAFESDDPSPALDEALPMQRAERCDGVDVERLRAVWNHAHTPEDFQAVLAAFRLTELEAFRALGTETAFPISIASVRALLALSVDLEVPVAFLVENGCATQRCTGTARSMRREGSAWRLEGRHFELSLRSELFGSAWIVRRPAMSGPACLELFDARGERVVRVEAGRGKEARTAWAILVGAHSEGSI